MNDIRIIPIYFYPFTRTQNQILDNINLFKQGLGASDSEQTGVNYQFNYRLGGAMDYDDTTILDDSPIIKGHTPLGEVSFSVDLSMQSFSQLFTTDTKLINKTIYDIKMLVFFKDYLDIKLDGIDKYFYYVENIVRKNANVYTFTLSLDVFKTYYNDIMEIKGLVPERYFIRGDDLHSYQNTEDELMTLGNKVISQSLSPSYNFNYNNTLYKITDSVILHDYFYISTPDIVGKYIIVVVPYSINGIEIKTYDQNNIINKDLEHLRSYLTTFKGTIKVVRSALSPINNMTSHVAGINYVIEDSTSYVRSSFTGTEKDIKVGNANFGNKSTINFYSANIIPEGINDNTPFIYIDNNNVNATIESDLFYNDIKLEWDYRDHIDFIKYKNLEYGTISSIVNTKPSISIGFANEEKVSIQNQGNDIIDFKMKLELSLFETRDLIEMSYRETQYTNLIFNPESSIYRVNEFTNPKLTDSYDQYILNNKNALIQKEKELNKFATRDTIVRGITTVVIAGLGVAGAVVSGGGSLAVAGGIIAGGMGAYNTVEGLSKNARARAMHNAELQDKKGVIENFTPSNYNENMDYELFLPFLYVYNPITNTHFRFNTLDPLGNNWTNALKTQYRSQDINFYGLKYNPKNNINNLKTMDDLITRNNYNYIEISDTTNAIQNGKIPNVLYSHVLEVLRNGINYSTIDYIIDNTIENKEVL